MSDETPKPPEDAPLTDDTAKETPEASTDAPEQPAEASEQPKDAPEKPAEGSEQPKETKPKLTDEEKAAKIAAAKAKAAAKKAAAEADAEPKPPWEEKPVPPERSEADDDPDVTALASGVEGSVLSAERFVGEVTVTVPAAKIVEICTHLKNEQNFTFLVDLTAVDWPEREEGRFDVVYWMHRFDDERRLRLRTVVAESETVDTVVGVWKTADWMEREVYDLFGIVFDGHPMLERILTWEGFNGHPLRKDFPVEGVDTGAAIYPDVYPPGGGPTVETEEGDGA
jgi:NADH-quinone oxidoreductase subunit C